MNPIRNGYWGDDDDSRCQLRLQASLRTLEVGFMLIGVPRPASTCQWRSLSLCNLIIFSLHCEQLHLSEPFCGPGGLGAARDGDAPRMGSHRDGGTKCTGLANLKILLNCECEMSDSCILLQITTETCCSTMIQTLAGLTEKVQLISIVTSSITNHTSSFYQHTSYLYIYIMEEKYALWE